MTSVMFKQWFYQSFVPSMKVYCEEKNIAFKILLLVDNAPCHPDLKHDNVKLHFLPKNTTSVIMKCTLLEINKHAF